MLLPDKVDQGPSRPCLIRQGSLYNLTFDEINSQLRNVGKSSNAMNLDELVKNVISAEDGNDLMQNPSPSASSSSSSASTFLGNFNLNKTFREKTIDEVWGEIIDHECANAVNCPLSKRQLTLGETTLEEFLIRAGVLSLGNQENAMNPRPLTAIDPMILVKQQADWLQFQMEHHPDQQQQQQGNLPMPIQGEVDSHFQVSDIHYDNQVFDVGYLDNQLELPIPLTKVEVTSSESHLGGERKRCYTYEMMEKSIERRQRRMIKNRESAARSRARKQAHTKQLEHDVLHLRETNNWLRRRKELQMSLHSNSPSGPKYQLRRTSSAEL